MTFDGMANELGESDACDHGRRKQDRSPGVFGQDAPCEGDHQHDDRQRNRAEDNRQDDHDNGQRLRAGGEQPPPGRLIGAGQAVLLKHVRQRQEEDECARQGEDTSSDVQRLPRAGIHVAFLDHELVVEYPPPPRLACWFVCHAVS